MFRRRRSGGSSKRQVVVVAIEIIDGGKVASDKLVQRVAARDEAGGEHASQGWVATVFEIPEDAPDLGGGSTLSGGRAYPIAGVAYPRRRWTMPDGLLRCTRMALTARRCALGVEPKRNAAMPVTLSTGTWELQEEWSNAVSGRITMSKRPASAARAMARTHPRSLRLRARDRGVSAETILAGVLR